MTTAQNKTDNKPFDMAKFAADLTGNPEMANIYREHERETGIINGLVDERVRQGLSQRDIAQKIGVSASTVCRFEDKPDGDLELGFLAKYANALGLHMALVLDDESQTDASRIKASVFSIQEQLKNLTEIVRKHPDDAALCSGIAKFQAEVLLNFLIKYGESADIPRVFDFMSQTRAKTPKAMTGQGIETLERNDAAAMASII